MRPAPKSQLTPINHSLAAQNASERIMKLADHLEEVRSRLFWIVLALIAAASFGYMIQGPIMSVLMSPLGGQRLIYLTPIGGFNFLFKVSIYFGIALVLPVIIYQLYRFLEPIMNKHLKKSVGFYSVASTLLAITGGCFAYFGSLPAAMHFLSGVSIQNVSAMVTADSYLSFVTTYILGFAALFQIPLIIMIFNTIKPIPPKKLLSYERHVILFAFIIAALISPSPDVTNQTILAVPIIIMYQIGLFMVWFQGRSSRKKNPMRATQRIVTPAPQAVIRPRASALTPAVSQAPTPMSQQATETKRQPRPTRPVMDVAGPQRLTSPSSATIAQRPTVVRAQQRSSIRPTSLSRPARTRPASIDGIVSRRPQQLPQTGF
jgi:sec-independent protein translocase protein TatC